MSLNRGSGDLGTSRGSGNRSQPTAEAVGSVRIEITSRGSGDLRQSCESGDLGTSRGSGVRNQPTAEAVGTMPHNVTQAPEGATEHPTNHIT